MSKKLHDEALTQAHMAYGYLGLQHAIFAYLAHLKAHGVKLTPREPTRGVMDEAPRPLVGSFTAAEVWTAMHDAAPDFPGEAE